MWLERLLYSKNCFFLLNSGYLLQAPNNLTFFSISLESSSYRSRVYCSIKRQNKKNNYPSAHSCTALTCSFSRLVMLLDAAASDCSVSILLFRSWFTWIPMPDDMRSNPQDTTWPITEKKKWVQLYDWKILLLIDCYLWNTCREKRWYGAADKINIKFSIVTHQACTLIFNL